MDKVNHPSHYTSHPSGIECIEITRHMSYNLGNALKYIWRCDLKYDAVEDLEKAIFYLKDEIEKRNKKTSAPTTNKSDLFDLHELWCAACITGDEKDCDCGLISVSNKTEKMNLIDLRWHNIMCKCYSTRNEKDCDCGIL